MAIEDAPSSAELRRENARLRGELAAMRDELARARAHEAEALDQQAAAGRVLQVLGGSRSDTQPVFDAIVASAVRLCDGVIGSLFSFDGEFITVAAQVDTLDEHGSAGWRSYFPMPPDRGTVFGKAILTRAAVHVADLGEDRRFPEVQRALGYRSALVVPLLREGSAIGAIMILRDEVKPFSDRQIELLETFADQAVIAIENTRLFRELRERNRELAEALEQQTATADILRATSGSATDLLPVLGLIADRAVHLCGAEVGLVSQLDGDLLRLMGVHGLNPAVVEVIRRAFPFRLDAESVTARAARTRAVVHIPDLLDDPSYGYKGEVRAGGYRSGLGVPMLRQGQVIGVIFVGGANPGYFGERQVELLQTFADQAVIAIENVRLYRELADKSRQLELASMHKSEFLANMSHELRTPLNAIIGFSEVLAEQLFGELNERQIEYAHDILTSGQHLLSLINDILDLSKVEAGRMELEVSTFSLREALENGLTMLKERAGRHDIALGLEIEDGLDAIEADERKVKQVVFNLVSNAVKFTPDGGRVELSARRTGDGVEVAVRDTGVGIAPEDLPHVFDEFRQVGRAEAKSEGTGLGLPLAKRFAELHGGMLWVESEPGRGSTFAFVLPWPTATSGAEVPE
jgi:signal transduction histidine kinase